ncbi:cytochrome P450 82A3-like [Cicer arietinum]|uniref:cytochrome P450 82A3-like n=1 Tax=Cicer arietinum TaxID=3827 RepID=UPI00032A86B9
MRLYPPAPLNLPHESIEDCIVGGYDVPIGMHLLTNILKLQRDHLLYSDSLEFRLERFFTTHKDVDIKGQNFELIPFDTGRRMCHGISFGLKLIQITFATLSHGLNIVAPNGELVDMVEESGLTNIKASPLKMIFTPRISTQVYSKN